MKSKLNLILGFIIFVSLIGFSSASYIVSNPQFTNPAVTPSFLSSAPGQTINFNSAMCQKGQDFIIQMVPGGCSPTVVRSDLLSQTEASVSCPIEALKVNPAVNINSIVSISFGENHLPPEVRSVSFMPIRSALGINAQLNQPGWNKIGYAVITLNQMTNESAMPNYVIGNLSATITYNAYDAFGSVDRTLYLPLISDAQFAANQGQYAFFNNMGYLRADTIGTNTATVSMYSGVNANLNSNTQKQKLLSYNLKVGQNSPAFFLPGFGCFASSYLTLDSIQGQDTRAVINVDGITSELTKGESFLNGACQVVSDPLRQGLLESVQVSCNTQSGGTTFTLRIEPTLNLSINGTVKQYKVGDWLYNNGKDGVYLGFVGTNSSGESIKNSLIYLVDIPNEPGKTGSKLDNITLNRVSTIVQDHLLTGQNVGDLAKIAFGKIATAYNWLFNGQSYQEVKYGNSLKAYGSNVDIKSFGIGTNLQLNNQTLETYYQNAVQNYQTILNSFKNEVYTGPGSLGTNTEMGAQALQQLINLSSQLQQRSDLKKYCSEFESQYPNSNLDISPCNGIPQYSDAGISSKTLLINGNYRQISFQGVQVPSFQDYGIEITIRKGSQVVNQPIKMSKGNTVYLDNLPPFSSGSSSNTQQSYIKLISIPDSTHAEIDFELYNQSKLSKFATFLGSQNKVVPLNTPVGFSGSPYTFTINRINLNKVAKVSVHTAIRDTTQANFQFKVGIEKRTIQLSPGQIKSQIKKFTDLTNKLQEISKSLGTVVKGLQKVCEGVGLALTAKSLLFNLGTTSLARKQVMTGPGGWDTKCQQMSGTGKEYPTQEQCLLDNSNLIESQVKQVAAAMNTQNSNFQNLQKIPGVTDKGGLFSQSVVNQTELAKYYSNNVTISLNEAKSAGCITLSQENFTTALGALSPSGFGPYYSIDDARQIGLYANLCSQNPSDSYYKTALNSALQTVLNNYNKNHETQTTAKKIGINPSDINLIQIKGSQEEIYKGKTLADLNGISSKIATDAGVPLSTPVSISQTTTLGNYVILLDNSLGSNQYQILKNKKGTPLIYDLNGNRVTSKTFDGSNILSQLSKIYFKKVSITNTPIKDPQVKYYETGSNKGLPAIVPVQPQKGWYAYIQPPSATASLGSGLSVSSGNYDLSGRVNQFYLCNAGANGIIEPFKGDDTCHLVNLGNSDTYTQIAGLSNPASMVNEAVKAIQKVSSAHTAGIQEVTVGSHTYKVGAPEVATQTTSQCTDLMSPNDCKILFNACDPVVCPSSRCNLGGKYPVQNVVQSGLFGSLALCLPNSVLTGGSDYVPVCLTGVKAGIDNLAQTTKDYVSCLNTSLNTGRTTGICDEIYNLYGCQLLWNTLTPAANIVIPKLESSIYGGGATGGGEYLGGIQAALNSAKQSAQFISQQYAVAAFQTFKARSQGSVGTTVCKNALSQVFPQGQGVINSLSQAQSPPQFNANFQAIPYSTTTNPPQVEYKVYYHIFAGNDAPANYQIYLKSSGTSYYQDSAMPIMVKSGVIPAGKSEDNTSNFVGHDGYTQVCIQVNNQEKCGFGKVSTSFASNYIADQYIKAEASTTNITTQNECISGTPNVLSLLNINLEAGLTNAVSPNINAAGITRVCASNNPGGTSDVNVGSASQRWVQVGYCGTPTVKCWIDTQSIVGATNFQLTANQTLSSLKSDLISQLEKQGGFINSTNFPEVLNNVTNSSKSLQQRIALIEKFYPKIFDSSNKAYLKYLEGGDYGILAVNLFKKLVSEGYYKNKNKVIISSGQWNSSVYNLNSGHLTSTNIHLKFFSNSWHWELLGKVAKGSGNLETPVTVVPDSWHSAGSVGSSSTLSQQEKSLISSLQGKNFEDGLIILMGKISQGKGSDINPFNWINNNFLSGSTLSANNVIFDTKSIFTYNAKSLVYSKMYFRYNNSLSGWQWSADDLKWSKVLGTTSTEIENSLGQSAYVSALMASNKISTAKQVEQSYSSYFSGIIKTLSGKDQPNGAAYLFEGSNYPGASVIGAKSQSAQGGPLPTISSQNLLACEPYYGAIARASQKYGVDPYLILAIMYQESTCNPQAGIPSSKITTPNPVYRSLGLMQINTKYYCNSKYGLPTNLNECESNLTQNTTKNIEVGTEILAGYYKGSPDQLVFNGCNRKGVIYSGWQAAIRKYNGLGCNPSLPQQDWYVENVTQKWNEFTSMGMFS